jgi:hypothetical protein
LNLQATFYLIMEIVAEETANPPVNLEYAQDLTVAVGDVEWYRSICQAIDNWSYPLGLPNRYRMDRDQRRVWVRNRLRSLGYEVPGDEQSFDPSRLSC